MSHRKPFQDSHMVMISDGRAAALKPSLIASALAGITPRKIAIASVFASLWVAGCSASQLDYRNAQINNGLIYSGSNNQPFSGRVTNVPESFIRPNSGYNTFISNMNEMLKTAKADKNAFWGRTFSCDVEVDDGYISGDVSCHQPNTRALRYTAQYDAGKMDGDMQVFALDGRKTIAKASFKGDLLDGSATILSPNSAKSLQLRNYKNGKPDGKQENYDETTGNVVYRQQSKDGLTVGKVETFNAQGSITRQIPYDDGVPHGIAYEWDANNNRMIGLTTFDHGAKTGESKTWSPDGVLTSDYVYARNAIVEDKLHPVQATANTCLTSLIDNFRKANGGNSSIDADQIEKWESSCGKNNDAPWIEE
ncbi:toxin-antitoxin system YwqK family antitoxin [Pseudomonas frederiksbergensis]|uniref:toxin-antitoxin system YwqK family antitoxin n=1 Tax=Pseudomonas frederiksbergensis TaxID=104087 RepID=UPI003D19B9A0